MLSENEIAELLAGNHRSESLTDSERARVRAHLTAFREATTMVEPAPAVDNKPATGEVVTIDRVARTSSTRPRRSWRTPVFAFAAAMLAVAAISVAVLLDRDGPETTIAGPAATAQPDDTDLPAPTTEVTAADLEAGAALCSGTIQALADGITAWGDIENWSHLTDARNPEPHLPTLALAAAQELDNTEAGTPLGQARADLRDVLSEAEAFSGFTPAIRTDVVQTLTVLVDGITATIESDLAAGNPRFDSCDLAPLGAG